MASVFNNGLARVYNEVRRKLMMTLDEYCKENGKRYFYFGQFDQCLSRFIMQARAKPLRSGDEFVVRRKNIGDGRYLLHLDDDLSVEIKSSSIAMDNGAYVSVEKKYVQRVYRLFKETWKQIESEKPVQEPKEITKPILPMETFKTFDELIFDFWRCIDELDTTKGFGNVGVILEGPPGVGKSETMRWISEVGSEQYNRGSYQLSMAELTNLLAQAESINAENYPIVFIDDIDASLLTDRRISKNPMTSQFLTCIDGLDKREGRVFIVSTNERLENVDPALIRPGRFDTIVSYGYPDLSLIGDFCSSRKIDINPELFENWSFARIDMFCAKYRVAKHRYNTALDVFYEKFVATCGRDDPTVEQHNGGEEMWAPD